MTVEEVLKSTGLTDEQIKALDPKVTGAFGTVLTTAETERSAAELAKRAQSDQYDKEIAPALANWANNEANLTAERDYYKTLAEKAKDGGFVADVTPFRPAPTNVDPTTRDNGGRFVAGKNSVPGSPEFVTDLRKEVGGAVGSMLDLQWKYQLLHGGKPMPDSPTQLIKEANDQRLDPIVYAAKKYDFAGKEKEQRDAAQKTHDDAIRKETADAKDKEWAEKVGNNPNIRQAEVSRFSDIRKAEKAGTRPDPLKMSENERDANTRRSIQTEVASDRVQ